MGCPVPIKATTTTFLSFLVVGLLVDQPAGTRSDTQVRLCSVYFKNRCLSEHISFQRERKTCLLYIYIAKLTHIMPYTFVLYFLTDSSRLEIPEHAVNLEEIEKVLSANILVDRFGQPRSAPLLFGYTPQLGTFLESLTIRRSQETLVEPTILFVARPASTSSSVDHSDLIPIGEVSKMAPPINPYQLMGKKSKEASTSKIKGKAKEGVKAKKSRRPIFEVIAPKQAAPNTDSGSAVPETQPQLP